GRYGVVWQPVAIEKDHRSDSGEIRAPDRQGYGRPPGERDRANAVDDRAGRYRYPPAEDKLGHRQPHAHSHALSYHLAESCRVPNPDLGLTEQVRLRDTGCLYRYGGHSDARRRVQSGGADRARGAVSAHNAVHAPGHARVIRYGVNHVKLKGLVYENQ